MPLATATTRTRPFAVSVLPFTVLGSILNLAIPGQYGDGVGRLKEVCIDRLEFHESPDTLDWLCNKMVAGGIFFRAGSAIIGYRQDFESYRTIFSQHETAWEVLMRDFSWPLWGAGKRKKLLGGSF